MDIIRFASQPFRYRPWQSRHAKLIADDLLWPASQPRLEHEVHLGGAINWLCHAQDVRNGVADSGSVSAGWSFEDGWLPGYPETTGYIIETFLVAAEVLGRPVLIERAGRMFNWELSTQLDDGAFPGHFGEAGSRPAIFNTGQIIYSMIASHIQFGRNECLEAALRAGHWRRQQQDDDGCWRRYEHNDELHVYDTRATWALAATGLLAGDEALTSAARRNLDRALGQQTDSGWFASNAFTPERSPFTHTIAYAIRGFMECGLLLEEERYLQAATTAARALAKVQRQDGWLAGTYRDGWVADAGYCCLTGLAQMSLNWTRLAQIGADEGFRAPARAALGYLKTTQKLDVPDTAIRGSIAGSSPIWGDYSRFEYPNWAAKFFSDALMMDMTDTAVPPRPQKPGAEHHG